MAAPLAAGVGVRYALEDCGTVSFVRGALSAIFPTRKCVVRNPVDVEKDEELKVARQ